MTNQLTTGIFLNFVSGSRPSPPSSVNGQSWPGEQLELLEQADVYRWFVPQHLGGLEWGAAQIAAAYVELASACLTTTFILTQRVAAIRRIYTSDNIPLRDRLLAGILAGNTQATVGIITPHNKPSTFREASLSCN